MTEQLIRDVLADKERLRDRVEDANRFGRIEQTTAIIEVQLEAMLERVAKGEQSVLDAKEEVMAAAKAEIQHFCEHVDSRLDRFEEQSDAKLNASLAKVVRKLDEGNRRRTDRIIKFGVAFAIILIPLVSGGGSELSKVLFRLWTGMP